MTAYWISGPTRSGKTARLIGHLDAWGSAQADGLSGQSFLVFALNGDTRIRLAERIASELQGRYLIQTTTPAGFVQDEVTLFWPLLVQRLSLNVQFPLLLRPENEQDLASRLWDSRIATGQLAVQGWLPTQLVRRMLDFLQLAAAAAIPTSDLQVLLPEGMPAGFASAEQWQAIAGAILEWRDWCLQRGIVTYGIMTELYWQHLLPQADYRDRLQQRFCGVLADDLDEYPAVARQWFEAFRQQAIPSAYTWNETGKVRLGLGADPEQLSELAVDCEVESLPPQPNSLAYTWADPIVEWVQDPLAMPEPVEAMQTLRHTSRAEILRATAEAVAAAIQQYQVNPGEIAIIAPGLDAIARYTLTEILSNQGIPVASLNDQRPLSSSPVVRALLTLLTLIYPGLGRLCDRDSVAEMLVVLSQAPRFPDQNWLDSLQIDPIRAQLIADHCFASDIEHPHLLPADRFPRWDRLGYRATQSYEALLGWIENQQQQRQRRLIPNFVSLLDRAIQQFLWGGSSLPYDQLVALRELMETAQRYWEIDQRLQLFERVAPRRSGGDRPELVGRFIQLLEQGTVSANPFPVQSADPSATGVIIATVFQYRTQRLCHRWQFWLDAGSPRWLTGTDALFGFPLFLSSYQGRPWTTDFIERLHQERLERILRDLLGRVEEKVFLCHSDLAVSGQEQLGPLLSLINVAETASEAVI